MIFKNLHLPSKLNIFVPPNELITQQLFGYESIWGGGSQNIWVKERLWKILLGLVFCLGVNSMQNTKKQENFFDVCRFSIIINNIEMVLAHQ